MSIQVKKSNPRHVESKWFLNNEWQLLIDRGASKKAAGKRRVNNLGEIKQLRHSATAMLDGRKTVVFFATTVNMEGELPWCVRATHLDLPNLPRAIKLPVYKRDKATPTPQRLACE